MEIKFLGTGIPVPNVDRCGQGVLISHGEYKILFDCGPGVNRRIIEAGIKHNDINYLFFTHLHWDHFGDYDNFVQTSFVTDREKPLQVYGPSGIQEVTDLLFKKVYRQDLIYRTGMRGPGVWKDPIVEEIFGGSETKIGPFAIQTFRVSHGEFVDFSLAFRIECEGKSVVISGDTAPVIGFEKFAKDCDVLIHEVFPGKPPSKYLQLARPNDTAEEFINRMGHCSPRQVGQIAKEVNPGKLVLIHLVKNFPDEAIDTIAKEYKGPIIVSQDMMEMEVLSASAIEN